MMVLLQYDLVLYNLSCVLTISGRYHHLFCLVGFCQAPRKQKMARFGLLRTVLFRYLLHYNLVPVLTKKEAQ